MGRNEPFWRSNTSFSPPSSGTWEQRFPAEGPSNESHGGGGVALSSQSSTSKGSRSWRRGDQLPHHNYSSSDGAMSYLSSPSDNFQAPQVLPSLARGLHVNEFVSTAMRGEIPFAHQSQVLMTFWLSVSCGRAFFFPLKNTVFFFFPRAD